MSALPNRLDGEARAQTTPRSPLVRAYGDGRYVVRCGVPRPDELRPTSQLFTVNGVDWFVEEGRRRTRCTLIGRAVFVELSLPADDPAAGPLVDLAAPVRRTLPPVRVTSGPVGG
jgi:hypothetical protein